MRVTIIICLRSTVNYTLKNPHGILGRISLFKSSYKLGEDITGALDLTTGTIACLQVLDILLYVMHYSIVYDFGFASDDSGSPMFGRSI